MPAQIHQYSITLFGNLGDELHQGILDDLIDYMEEKYPSEQYDWVIGAKRHDQISKIEFSMPYTWDDLDDYVDFVSGQLDMLKRIQAEQDDKEVE